MFLLAISLTGTVDFLSQLLQETYGMSPLRSGLAVLPLAVTQAAVARITPRVVAGVGRSRSRSPGPR